MFHEINPYKLDIKFKNEKPSLNDYALCFTEREVLLKFEEGEYKIPKFSELKNKNKELPIEGEYLFSLNDNKYFKLNDVDINEEDYKMQNISIFMDCEQLPESIVGLTAYHIHKWNNNHKYCGICGDKMVSSTDERSRKCNSCENTEYPTIAPAIIVGVIDGDKIVMTKYLKGPYKKYALVAGFVEVGESLEDTVKREVMEEVGLKVKGITYFRSQPWALSQSMMIGFFAKLDGNNKITKEDSELSDAKWVSRKDIVLDAPKGSITYEMTKAFKENKVKLNY